MTDEHASRLAYHMAVDAVQHTTLWSTCSDVEQVTDLIKDYYEKVLADNNTPLGLAVFVAQCKCITAMSPKPHARANFALWMPLRAGLRARRAPARRISVW
jgi:hypothetical protein